MTTLRIDLFKIRWWWWTKPL